jgi:hypothetical protein
MTLAFAGFLAGFVHVLSGPDHLAAIAPYAVDGKRRAGAQGFGGGSATPWECWERALRSRRGPKVRSTYWPHRVNFERLSRSRMDWRLLYPGAMVDESALGRLNKQIAADLGTSEIPVKIHRGRVLRKMQAKSLAELVRLAARLELPRHTKR